MLGVARGAGRDMASPEGRPPGTPRIDHGETNMKAGISSFCAVLALAATPVLGCAGSQHDRHTSPVDSSVPASGSRSGSGSEAGETSASPTGHQGMSGMDAGPAAGGQDAAKQVTVTIDPKSGSKLTGTATFKQQGGKVELTVEVKGAPAGVHAVHIHENGDCTSVDGESAGGHWNPTKEAHGKWGDAVHHMGDIGNLTVNADGSGTLTMSTDHWTIGTGQANDITGHAVVVHTKADDFKSQPAGAAGARIGCGVIQKK